MSQIHNVDMDVATQTASPLLSRVRIRNYKSIEKCDVSLGALTILVGRNGSGKSNFLDALRFTVDGLQTSLDHPSNLEAALTPCDVEAQGIRGISRSN